MHTCLCSRCRRYAHVCVWTHVLMHMCIHTEAKDQSPVSFSTLFRLLFETRFLTKPGACQLCRLTGQQAPKICLSPALLCWGTSTHHSVWLCFSMGSGVPNWCLQACASSTLLTKPFLQTLISFFKWLLHCNCDINDQVLLQFKAHWSQDTKTWIKVVNLALERQ